MMTPASESRIRRRSIIKGNRMFLGLIFPTFTLAFVLNSQVVLAASLQETWRQVAKRTQAQKTAGLSGGEGWQRIYSISYAPSDGNIAYFVTDTNQVWKSSDGGASWMRKGGDYPANGGISLAVDPTNANIVYVAGSVMGNWTELPGTVEGIFRTANGGDTWTLVKAAHFHSLAGAGVHFAFAGGNIYAAPSTGGLLKSTNGGTAWNLVSKSGGGYVLDTVNFYDLKAHPTDSTILYASASDGKFYKIKKIVGSAAVTQIGTGLPLSYQVQIDRDTPSIIYAAAGTYGIYRSTDSGLNFSARNNGLSTPIGLGGSVKFGLAMSPINSNRLFLTFSNLFGKYLYYTIDGGANWTQTSNMDKQNADGWVAGSIFGWTANLSGVMDTSAPLALHPTNQNIALTSGYGDSVKKTADGGVTWEYSNTGYTGSLTGMISGPSAIGWDAVNSNRASFSHSDFGTLITTNGENTFTNIASAVYAPSVNKRATHSIAMNGDIIVETVGQYGPVSVFVSRNSGTSWTDAGATNATDMDFISFNPQNSSMVYAGKYRFDNIGTSNAYTTLDRVARGILRATRYYI